MEIGKSFNILYPRAPFTLELSEIFGGFSSEEKTLADSLPSAFTLQERTLTTNTDDFEQRY